MLQSQAISSIRRLIQDGQTQDSPPVLFNLVRSEDLTAQIPAVESPTQTQFLVRFAGVPTEEYVTVFPIAGTLVAYVDMSSSPTTPSIDLDAYGNFTLPEPPQATLAVSYGWAYFTDVDILDFADQARQWVGGQTPVPDLASIPDGLAGVAVEYAASLALGAMARKCSLADATAGNAKINLSDIAKSYSVLAAALAKSATAGMATYWTDAGARQAPAIAGQAFALGNWQPRR